jgi:hypothetical protein
MSGALAEIRALYFRASKSSIADDFDRAIELLKAMATEEERERATVYMEGLAEMRKQWRAGRTKNIERRIKNTTQNVATKKAKKN